MCDMVIQMDHLQPNAASSISVDPDDERVRKVQNNRQGLVTCTYTARRGGKLESPPPWRERCTQYGDTEGCKENTLNDI